MWGQVVVDLHPVVLLKAQEGDILKLAGSVAHSTSGTSSAFRIIFEAQETTRGATWPRGGRAIVVDSLKDRTEASLELTGNGPSPTSAPFRVNRLE